MIHAQNIVKYYGTGESRFQALRGIDLDIGDGESAVILGASGSGKSTLLNILRDLNARTVETYFMGMRILPPFPTLPLPASAGIISGLFFSSTIFFPA